VEELDKFAIVYKMSKDKDKFGKTDIAQILAGAFIIGSTAFMGAERTISLFLGFSIFMVFLTVAVIIFGITSLKRSGFFMRLAITIPALFLIALLLEFMVTQQINISKVFVYTGIALPISAGIDALRD